MAAFLIGIVGGFSTVLGPSFVQDIGIAYNNTTWTALAQATSTAACAPILGKVGDVIGRKRTLLLGIAVFTLGNVLSALANSLVFMMIARFVVGICTAARCCDLTSLGRPVRTQACAHRLADLDRHWLQYPIFIL